MIHTFIVEWWDIPIFLWRKAFEPGLARVYCEDLAASCTDGLDEVLKICVFILVIHTEPTFDRDRNRYRITHRVETVRDQQGLAHQAGAKAPGLHAIGRTADIEVDFVVAELLADACRLGQLVWVGTTDLQRQRMFQSIESKQALVIAMDQRRRSHHFGVKPRIRRQQAMEVAAVPISPVHHRRNGKQPRIRGRVICKQGHAGDFSLIRHLA